MHVQGLSQAGAQPLIDCLQALSCDKPEPRPSAGKDKAQRPRCLGAAVAAALHVVEGQQRAASRVLC